MTEQNLTGPGAQVPKETSAEAGGTASPRIFINYRRDDTAGDAGRLHDALSAHFGKGAVFMDVDTIQPGADFADVINQAVGSCEALVTVIGKNWLGLANVGDRRRLDDQQDLVRREIQIALERKIRVVPVLVQGAQMPRADQLPDSLVKLAGKNAFEISYARWQYDVDRLISALEGSGSKQAAPLHNSSRQPTSAVDQVDVSVVKRTLETVRLLASDPPGFSPMDERWRRILGGETRAALGPRLGRRLFALIPSPWRCKFCNAPFHGPYAGAFRTLGYSPSRKNPAVCARCIESAPQGGAVVPLTVLFADVRGYTRLAEQLTAVEATALMNRFYVASSKALLMHEAVLGQIAGDEVMALFFRGLAGPSYPSKAIDAAIELLSAVGYRSPHGNWIDVGVGICTGEEYAGNVGGGGFKDFTAIGDVTNTAARLQGIARSGEIVMCAKTYAGSTGPLPTAQHRQLQLDGRSQAVECYVLPAT